MTTYDIISDLCKQHGIAITALEKELGFGRGYIGKFKTGGTSPTVKKLQQIADYFGVPVSDLVPGSERAETDGYYINPETAATPFHRCASTMRCQMPTVNVCSATVLEMILPMQCTVTGRWRNCELRLRR